MDTWRPVVCRITSLTLADTSEMAAVSAHMRPGEEGLLRLGILDLDFPVQANTQGSVSQCS